MQDWVGNAMGGGNVRIIFVYRGYSPFLEYAVAQARSCGYQAIVIGDKAARCAEGEFVDVGEFSTGVSQLQNCYKHRSVNKLEYERLCFERWFIISDYLKQKPGPAWVADHDVLVYKGLDLAQEWMFVGSADDPIRCFNSAWFNFFPNERSVALLTDFFLEIFQTPVMLTSLSEKFALNGQPHISDMHALLEYGWKNPGKVVDVALAQSSFGIDKNIRDITGFSSRNGHKLASWKNEVPYIFNEKKWKQYLAFHFQGQSKYLMQSMHNINDCSFKNYLQDFTEVVNGFEPGDTTQLVRDEFFALLRGRR